MRSALSAVVVLSSLAAGSLCFAADPPPAAKSSPLPAPKVTLLEPGTGELAPIRFAFRQGDTATMVMTMDMQMTMTMNGQPVPPTPTPAMEMVADGVVREVRANGEADVRFTYTKMGVNTTPTDNPAIVQQMESMLNTAVGLVVECTMTPRGIVTQASVGAPAGLAPMIASTLDGMKESLTQMATPMPEEPIGVGARWKIETPMTTNGMSIRQITTATLRERTGDVVALDIQVEQEADPQNLASAQLPPGTVVHIDSFGSEATGKSRLQLNSIVPLEAEASSNGKAESTISSAGAPKQTMTQHISMTLKIERGAPATP